MAFSELLGATEFEEKDTAAPHLSLPLVTVEQAGIQSKDEQLKVSIAIHTENLPFTKDRRLWLNGFSPKIETAGFSPNYPWLPPVALRLLDKLKLNLIKEKELVWLMGIVADRAAEHFQIMNGKFVAMTFWGRIVEVSDSRVGLLKNLQGHKLSEQIFVWRTGFKAFSGRI